MLTSCRLMPTGPPATKLTALADVSGAGEDEKMSIAKFVTISYMISPVICFAVVGSLKASLAVSRWNSDGDLNEQGCLSRSLKPPEVLTKMPLAPFGEGYQTFAFKRGCFVRLRVLEIISLAALNAHRIYEGRDLGSWLRIAGNRVLRVHADPK